MKRLKRYESFNESRLENLRKMRDENNEESDLQKLKDYVEKTYTEEWFDMQLSDNVNNYIDEDDAEDYEGDYEEAYRNLCMGGAIEYDLLDEMNRELKNMFPNIEEEIIDNTTNDNMLDVCSWCDRLVFNRSDEEYKSAFDKMMGGNVSDLMDGLD